MFSEFEWEMAMTVEWGEERRGAWSRKEQVVCSNLAGVSPGPGVLSMNQAGLAPASHHTGKVVPDSYQHWLGGQWNDITAFCKSIWPFSWVCSGTHLLPKCITQSSSLTKSRSYVANITDENLEHHVFTQTQNLDFQVCFMVTWSLHKWSGDF